MFETFDTKLGQSVKMTELYDFLGLDKSQYSRFVKKELIDSYYFEDGKDYFYAMKSNAVLGKKGQFRREIIIHINTAKKLCMRLFRTQKKATDTYALLMKMEKTEVLPFYKTRKELLFEINLVEILKDIFEVITQYQILNYRIDFYIPSIRLAIEYDEDAHKCNTKKDTERQYEIQKVLKCDFVRVKEGFENEGINEILKYVLYHSCADFSYNDNLTPEGQAIWDSLNDLSIFNDLEKQIEFKKLGLL